MAVPGSYSLKWHGHGLHLNASVCGLYKSEAFTDVVLATSDGRYFSAHQFVLSSCSQYLQKMIMIGSTIKSLSKIVVVLPPEIKHSTLNILLQYIYKGEAIVNHEQLPNIMKAAELLQIRGLSLGKDKTPTIDDMLNNRFSKCSENNTNQQNKESLCEQKINRESTKINPSILIPEINYNEPEIVIVQEVNKGKEALNLNRSSRRLYPPRKKRKESQDSSSDSREDANSEKNAVEDIIEELIVGEEIHVKEEPLDWEEDKSDELIHSFVKEEAVTEDQEMDDDDDEESNCYVPLTCDLCQQTFKTPALWVHHIEEEHPFTALASGRRSSLGEVAEGEFTPLNCELCQKVFTVPAEWVRHIQTHSEKQQAKTYSKRVSTAVKSPSHTRVECDICGKITLSQASLEIHAHTHTGERNFHCKVCGRDFTTKSNLLRHIRSVHDQCAPSSSIDDIIAVL